MPFSNPVSYLVNRVGISQGVSQVPSSYDSLSENPLVAVISELQGRRAAAATNGREKPTIDLFLRRFEDEMMRVEETYQGNKHTRREHMRLFQ